MKKFALIISVTLLAVGAMAQANSAETITIPSGTVAVAGVSNVNAVLEVTKQASVSFVMTAKQSAAGTNGPIKLLFDYSNDRSKWSTATKPVTFAATGLTELVGQTNIPTYGARFIRWKTIENADSGGITNLTATYAIKVGAP